ncbi:peptidoglycan DD-metalloendopeptidase family protein [Streptomyces sp. SID8379]|uniref:M23 family metallopeptidase n=1 Tax=unclassified Streptomyces TaxID=2593676 RepID=UPI00037F72A5|nr:MULTISPECIES: M23 family metallopeptidase [unclassified Streptomyces]MYW70252.1 peptidoglycan DD-metalloendopeptidase family protein [Streptomyces sp. SID8379]
MSKRTQSHRPGTSMLRKRAAVVAAGFGVSAVLGTGAAFAADTQAAALPSGAAASVKAQAAAQAKAASSTEQAATKKAASWVDPVAHYTLSAGYAQGGSMWATGHHSGQDFAVPTGTGVMSVHGGTVVKAGPNGAGDGPAYGNAIVIKHADGTYSQYAHLSRIDVHVGQTVSTGQHIALSGSTGNSSGPHLHFEIRTTPNYGSAVNPVAFMNAKGVKV